MSTLGQYRATPETLNDGDQRYPRLDSTGALVLSAAPTTAAAVTIADGADVAEGATAAAAYSDATGAAAGTLTGLNKGLYVLTAAMSAKLPASLGIKTAAASLSIAPASDAAFSITGTYISGAYSAQTTGTFGALKTDQYYNLRAAAVLVAGAGADGNSNSSAGFFPGAASGGSGQLLFAAMYPHVFNGTSWDRAIKSNANSRLLSSAATTNGTSVKATAGNVFKISGNNTVASKRYLKLYNKASAPTVGTDTPVMTICLLASAAFDISFAAGLYFATGIAYAITGAAADADTTAISAADIECLNLTYA